MAEHAMMDTYMNYTNSVTDNGKLTHNDWAVVKHNMKQCLC